MSALIPVDVKFLGTTLRGVMKGGQRYVALRPIVDGMGLAWQSQHAKITSDEVLGPTVTEIVMVAEDGRRRAMTCIPAEFLQGWMFTIKPGKVRAELKGKIIHYKRECYRVLNEAFESSSAGERAAEIEYLPGYHELHGKVGELAVASSNERAVHMNFNKLVNKTVGIGAGQRQSAATPTKSAIIVAQNLAIHAMAAANDHHDGYQAAKRALGSFEQLLLGRQA